MHGSPVEIIASVADGSRFGLSHGEASGDHFGFLARFVDGYVGEPGAPFRHAVADHFAVSLRTVESDLPRAVEHGALTAEVLPRRGAPKAYVLSLLLSFPLNYAGPTDSRSRPSCVARGDDTAARVIDQIDVEPPKLTRDRVQLVGA